MIPPPPIRPDRWRLGFKPAVLSAFRFLEDMGFRVARAEVTFVRYEGPRTFVNVYHGRASYELGVEIGDIAEAHPFHIGTIENFMGGRPDVGGGGGTARNPALLARFVLKLADRTRGCAALMLRGDPPPFSALRAYVERENAAELRRQALHDARAAADRARIVGDWAAIARAYEPIAAELTPMERRRLGYAQKMIRQAGGKR